MSAQDAERTAVAADAVAPIRFVILAARRSGSNMLCSLLDSHPDVLCHHELFNPQGIHTALDLRGAASPLHDPDARARDPLAFLAHAWRCAYGHRAVGFKMTPDQFPEVAEAVLADPRIAKIVLRRNNPLRMLVSERIAEATGRWEAYRGEAPPGPRPRVRVEPDELRRHIERNAAYYAGITGSLAGSGQRWLELRYECLQDADEQRRLLDYLALPPHPLQTRSLRQNPEPLQNLLHNAADLRRQLAGTPLADAFD